MERLIAVVAVLAGIVSAIDSTTTVSSGPAATHTIKVGWPVGQNNFFPNVIVNASVGATIRTMSCLLLVCLQCDQLTIPPQASRSNPRTIRW